MRILLVAVLVVAALLAGCGGPSDITDEIGLTSVSFPNGARINAETMRTDIELLKGLMFRESLPAGRGMLFIHPEENIFHYWMYQTKIPLDIIWMDHDRRIVEMSLDTPPCTSKSAKECPAKSAKELLRLYAPCRFGLRLGLPECPKVSAMSSRLAAVQSSRSNPSIWPRASYFS